jgi:hypothetical protein
MYLINIQTFENIVECNNINCKINKIKIPDELNEIKNKYEISQEKLKALKEVKSNKINFSKITKEHNNTIKILTELFTKTFENKKYVKSMIEYLNDVKKKCNSEYIIYIKELLQINHNCDIDKVEESNMKKEYMKNKNDNFLLNIIITKYTKYIIKKLNIDKKIIDIENKRYFILTQFLYNSVCNIDMYNNIFNFMNIKKYKFTDKYAINNKIITLNNKIMKYNFMKEYKNIKDNDIETLYNLYEDYVNEFCNVLKNIIKNKEYIQDYKDFCNMLKQKDEKMYKQYINSIEYLIRVFTLNTKLMNQFKISLEKLLNICK